jgi:hypothetical protein
LNIEGTRGSPENGLEAGMGGGRKPYAAHAGFCRIRRTKGHREVGNNLG